MQYGGEASSNEESPFCQFLKCFIHPNSLAAIRKSAFERATFERWRQENGKDPIGSLRFAGNEPKPTQEPLSPNDHFSAPEDAPEPPPSEMYGLVRFFQDLARDAGLGAIVGAATTPLDLKADAGSRDKMFPAFRDFKPNKEFWGRIKAVTPARVANIAASYALFGLGARMSAYLHGRDEPNTVDNVLGGAAEIAGTGHLYQWYRAQLGGATPSHATREMVKKLKDFNFERFGSYAGSSAVSWAPTILLPGPLTNFFRDVLKLDSETAKKAADVTSAVLSSGASNLRNMSVPGATKIMGGAGYAFGRDALYFLAAAQLAHAWGENTRSKENASAIQTGDCTKTDPRFGTVEYPSKPKPPDSDKNLDRGGR